MTGRNHEIRIKFNVEELSKVKRKAEALGMSISTFLRVLGLSANISPT